MADSLKRKKSPVGLAGRLRILSDRCGGPSRLAEKAGVSASIVSRCLSDESAPNLASAAAIARAGGVTLDWLATGQGSPDRLESEMDSGVQFFDLQASAGPGLIAPEHDAASERIALPISQIRRQSGVTSTNLCALLTRGDSMEPTIRNGALLLLDRSVQHPREGIHVIQRGDDVLVKRIQLLGTRSVRLISDNPRYIPEDMPLADPSIPVRFVGLVIWIGQVL